MSAAPLPGAAPLPDAPGTDSVALQELPSGPAPRLPAPESNAGISRIVLTGFMGAGKSTVGPLLAERLGWGFLDVDLEIESVYGASIARLFADHGEPWFREVEYAAIHSLLDPQAASRKNLVLALGGGAIEDARTRSLLLESQNTRLIHLQATLETVLLRCRSTEAQRPILRDHANLESRYARRLPLYREAHLTLAVDSLLPDAVAAAIAVQLGIASAD